MYQPHLTHEENMLEVIALNNNHHQYGYGREVTFHIRDQHRGDYQRAADFINLSPVDVVSLQHEYGSAGMTAITSFIFSLP